MATVILRPNTIGGTTTGWHSGTLSYINDANDSTSWVQNNSTCLFRGGLDNLDSSLGGATINSFTISGRGVAGRAGSSSAVMSLIHSSDGAFAAETENYSGSNSTETTTAKTTQQDGSSALTFAYINNCEVSFDPDGAGTTLLDLWVTVDYTAAAGYANTVNGVAPANINTVKGVAKANISKVNGA